MMRFGALLLICVYLSLVQPFWSLLPDLFRLFDDIIKQQMKNLHPSHANNQNNCMPQNSDLTSMNTASTSEEVRHVNSWTMNATMWLHELDATGHDLACPYDWKWGLIRAEWGLTKIGCVKKFEGLRVDLIYVTVKASDISLLPGGLLGPLSDSFRPLSGTLDRAVTEFAMVAKLAVLSWFVVSMLAVSSWFVVSVLRVCAVA